MTNNTQQNQERIDKRKRGCAEPNARQTTTTKIANTNTINTQATKQKNDNTNTNTLKHITTKHNKHTTKTHNTTSTNKTAIQQQCPAHVCVKLVLHILAGSE